MGLLPHGSEHQEWEKLGFPICIIYFDQVRAPGDAGGQGSGGGRGDVQAAEPL